MDRDPVDTPEDLADRARALCSVQKDDEILVIVSLVRDGETRHSASFYLRTACDLCSCLDLAENFAGIGANAIYFKAATWRSPRYEYVEWSWRRESKAAQQTKALLESKKKRDAKRDAAAAAHVCASCGHTAGAHEPPGVEAYGCHGGGGDCTCEGFSSGLVRTVAR
jgi:rubrerythrin